MRFERKLNMISTHTHPHTHTASIHMKIGLRFLLELK